MADTPEQLIALYEREESKVFNTRSLYQDVADLMFPRESQITSIRTPGEEFVLSDPTGVMASIEMASGLFINWFPPGQKFYNIVMSDKALNEKESVKNTLGQITEISHEKRANSNFVLQANETLRSLCTFGTGNMFSEWVAGIGLNYKDWDVGRYVILENNRGIVDTMMIKYPKTARQAVQEWGDNAGKSVLDASKDPKKENELFWFLRIIRPRAKTTMLTDNLHMPFESLDINIKDKKVIDEGGFEEFPHQVPRWSQSSNEVWGRGPGTVALATVRGLQVMKRDLVECGNKWNNPPREAVANNVPGEIQTFPKAINWVTETGSIKAMDEGIRGNFPITKDLIEMERDEVKKLFLNDIFIQLRDLKGDRRNELEIRARLTEGLQRLGLSYGKLTQEWLNPLVTRDIMLLLRNGELPPLPPEMQGQSFKIEYVGRLAMELKGQQARGWQQWVAAGIEINSVFPVTDNIDFDGGFRRFGETSGVSIEDMASADERDAKREDRRQKEEARQAMEIAQLAGQAYPGATKAPEPGSAAEALIGAA